MKLLPFFLLVAHVGAQTILRVAVTGAPVTWDPHLIATPFPYHAQFLMQVYESPLECAVDAQGLVTVVPALCEIPVTSPDGLRLTLKVRRGAKFHDDKCFEGGKGREVVARDVAFSLLRHADPMVNSESYGIFVANRFKGVDEWRAEANRIGRADYDAPPAGIRAEGDQVVIELLAPYPQLRALLTQPWASVIPPEAVNMYGTGFARPVGTGPFVLADVDPVRVRLLRNPSYRVRGLPKVDEVRLAIVPDPALQASRYLAGDLDVINVATGNEKQIVDSKGQILPALKSKGHALVQGAPLSVSYLVFNVTSPVFGKREVREAVTRALDRDAIVKASDGERALRADFALPTSFPEAAQIRLDPWALAKRDAAAVAPLLEAAGYPTPADLPEVILDLPLSAADPRAETAAGLIVSQLGDAGIRARLRKEPFDRFLARAAEADFHVAWVAWYADYPDAENFLLLFRSDKVGGGFGNNYGRYADKKVDELYTRIGNELPGHARTADVTELLRKVRDDCVWVPLSFPSPLTAMAPGVQGYRASVLNYSLRDVGKKK